MKYLKTFETYSPVNEEEEVIRKFFTGHDSTEDRDGAVTGFQKKLDEVESEVNKDPEKYIYNREGLEAKASENNYRGSVRMQRGGRDKSKIYVVYDEDETGFQGIAEFKINESEEVVSKLEEFSEDVKVAFAEILDYITDPVFYVDGRDQIFIKFDKPQNFESIYDLEDDLEVAFARLKDNYEFYYRVSDYSGVIKVNMRLGYEPREGQLPSGFSRKTSSNIFEEFDLTNSQAVPGDIKEDFLKDIKDILSRNLKRSEVSDHIKSYYEVIADYAKVNKLKKVDVIDFINYEVNQRSIKQEVPHLKNDDNFLKMINNVILTYQENY
jgi:hypothetical protein